MARVKMAWAEIPRAEVAMAAMAAMATAGMPRVEMAGARMARVGRWAGLVVKVVTTARRTRSLILDHSPKRS
jgi:hypothetical protein